MINEDVCDLRVLAFSPHKLPFRTKVLKGHSQITSVKTSGYLPPFVYISHIEPSAKFEYFQCGQHM